MSRLYNKESQPDNWKLRTDRIFGGLALFVEGYLFYFHLHGRSNIDTRVHILLVMTVWPSALIAFLQCFFMTKRKLLHVLEMLATTLLIAQGIWFWQVAYILYPPHGEPWDPCMRGGGHSMMMDMHHGDDDHHEDAVDCNDTMEAEMNLMFITLFWSWHLALSIFIVCTVYFCVYKMLKRANSLDSRFVRPGYESMLAGSGGKSGRGNGHVRNGLGSSLLTEVDDDEL